MTIQDVAKIVDLSWGTIKQIDKEYLDKYYSKPRIKEVEYIAIDEFAIKKGHVYQTIVYDLKQGRVIYLARGREEECLDKFWKRVRSAGAKIKAVATDMWPAYISSVMKNCPDADIVFDHFHIKKKVNEALDEVRRSLYRDEEELNKRTVIKGTRWLLLRNYDNLKEGNQKKHLEEALLMNKPLAEAYYLKEDLQYLWKQDGKAKAEEFLDNWLKQAWAATATVMKKLANTIASHRSGILNWYKHPISTGPLEGINNKIKVLKRKAYGYRDMDYFNLKIYALHETTYALL
jgi:transposase